MEQLIDFSEDHMVLLNQFFEVLTIQILLNKRDKKLFGPWYMNQEKGKYRFEHIYGKKLLENKHWHNHWENYWELTVIFSQLLG